MVTKILKQASNTISVGANTWIMTYQFASTGIHIQNKVIMTRKTKGSTHITNHIRKQKILLPSDHFENDVLTSNTYNGID